MSQDCFVKLELSDKNILLCPTFRLEQKSTVTDGKLKDSCTNILIMPVNDLSVEVGFGSSLMDCREQVLSNYFGLCKMSLRIACNASGLLLCWHFIMSSPGPKPNKIADVEVKNKCSKEFRLPDIS
jgi:hypothetical protein